MTKLHPLGPPACHAGYNPTAMTTLHLLLALSLSAALTACARPNTAPVTSQPPDPPVSVITSITVLADLIRQVAGERARIVALVPSGADPHTFQPAPRHVLAVAQADVVFFNGLGLDRTVRTVVNNAARPELPIVVLSGGLPTIASAFVSEDRAPPGGAGSPAANPYLWLDPRNAIMYVERVRDGLTTADPAGAAEYRARAARYLDRLRALDVELEAQLAAIPPEQRKLVTLHDGFPYFAERYGFEIVSVVIKTPGREPSAQEVADVARVIRQHGVRTVFTEPQLDARLLKLAARDAGLNISTLYSDTLDQTVPTYEALLRYNARQLVNGLR